MLLTPHKIVIISEFNPVKIPAGEPLNYYDLAYKKSPENVLVASSGWEQGGWTAIGNHRVVLIDRAKLEIESFEI